MTKALPELFFGLGDGGNAGAVVAGTDVFTSMTDLIARHPALLEEAHILSLARAANCLARGDYFEVIADPAAYETAARARIASEDPSEPFVQGVYRLRDFGMPDFAALHAPRRQGDRVVFCAVQALTGLPYLVSVAADGTGATYAPAPLVPLPDPEPDALSEKELDRRAEAALAAQAAPPGPPRRAVAMGTATAPAVVASDDDREPPDPAAEDAPADDAPGLDPPPDDDKP